MISVPKAKAIIRKHIPILESETVSLNDAGHRILAQRISAAFPMPKFDNSAMDGFAVRSVDLIGASRSKPITLKMVAVSAAGSPTEVEIQPGECIQCMTGAQIPEGADAIVIVEDSSGFSNSELVQIFSEVNSGKHIRKQGEEIGKEEVLISKGTPITPGEIGTCATFGFSELTVFRKPRVAIFATGDELIEPGDELEPGKIYNSNLYVFAELVKRVGAKVVMRNVIKDDRNALHSFLSEALEICDIVISSGGVSMGRFDYVREVFMKLGVEEHFWKVAQKPGKPLFFGTTNSTMIFGLPGNPVSAYIGFMEWVWPVLEKMSGTSGSAPLTGILTAPFPRDKTKWRFLFGKAWVEEETIRCEPSPKTGSHMLSSALGANCILMADDGDEPLNFGDKIQFKLLPWMSL